MTPRRRPTALLLGAVAGVVVAVAGVLAVTSTIDGTPQPGPTLAPVSRGPVAPLASPTGFYVDPDSLAARQREQWVKEGRTDDAKRIGVIAAQPVPQWLTAPTGEVGKQASDYIARAAAVKQRPLLVAYFVPFRDCSSYSGGGAKDADDYRAWIREVAATLKGRAATIVLEPDAVPHEISGCGRVEDRPALLADAVRALKGAGPVTVYVDAGNPGFVTDIGALADALRRSGVEQADGFSLNVANFYRTDEVVGYGRQVSAALDGKHFVVDTSRNGNGRPDGDTIDGGPAFCNPPGRAIGRLPTTQTGDPAVDAFLWIKRVGESDGACRPGEPEAGQWWPSYALGLVPS